VIDPQGDRVAPEKPDSCRPAPLSLIRRSTQEVGMDFSSPDQQAMEDKKDGYRLWYEYLKRNKNYAEFCQRIDANKSVPEDSRFLSVYLNWGNVHKHSFEEWRAGFAREAGSRETVHHELKEIIPQAVEPLGKRFCGHGRHVLESFRMTHRREPTAEELLDAVEVYFESGGLYGTALFTVADLSASSTKAKLEFERVLADVKRGLSPASNVPQFPHFSGRIYRDELKRYLERYDEVEEANKKGKTAYHVFASGTISPARPAYRDLEKAERIIANVEHNIFPGKYDTP
jgi:hypothetical protein